MNQDKPSPMEPNSIGPLQQIESLSSTDPESFEEKIEGTLESIFDREHEGLRFATIILYEPNVSGGQLEPTFCLPKDLFAKLKSIPIPVSPVSENYIANLASDSVYPLYSLNPQADERLSAEAKQLMLNIGLKGSIVAQS